MSANSLEEMLCEWEKLAKAASDEDWKYSGMSVMASAGIIADIPTPQRGGTFLCCANRDYIVHSDPAFALSLISLVRAALVPHLPVEELPETVERPSIRQREECTHDTLRYYTVDYVYGDDFTEYADAIEAQLLASQSEVARLREERNLLGRKLALIFDEGVYGDSLGVEGSDFQVCRWCGGGSGPGGKPGFKHNAGCLLDDGALEAKVMEFWESTDTDLVAQLTDRAEAAETALKSLREES